MAVLAIIGVLSASAVPSIVDMVKKAEGEQALVESASALAGARDGARSQGVCLDYVQSPGNPNAGPYTLQVFEVTCPGESPPRERRLVFERAASPSITSLAVTVPGTALRVNAIHFDRNGALYDPVARLRVDAVVNGAPRSYSIYPAAGTISFDEIK
jgi:Tfp pilus assembly protein FimT